MKRFTTQVLIFTSLMLMFFSLAAFLNHPQTEDKDYTTCLKKYTSAWGEFCVQCSDWHKSYRVNFRNTCTETIDVKCGVQEVDKHWRTYTILGLATNDTISSYACEGTGKYMLWARKTGDRINEFPSDDDINSTKK